MSTPSDPTAPPFPSIPPTPSSGSSMAPRPERSRRLLLELRGENPGAVFSIGVRGVTIGRHSSSDVQIEAACVSPEHARITVQNDGAYLEDLGSRAGTFLNSRLLRGQCRLEDGDYLCPGGGKTLVKFCLVDELEERALRTSFELMLRDPLTRLFNRRYFDERLFSEFAFARREGLRLALLVIDLDDLQRHRAEYGYQVADAALNVVAGSVQKLMRPDDILTRYDGDAFALLARGMSLRNVSILADRLCQQIRALSLELPDRRLSLSVSVGSSCLEPGQPFDSAHALLDAARVALFRSQAAEPARASSVPP